MKKTKEEPEKIDLLIVDIDDALIYHRTIALRNVLFLSQVSALFGTEARTDRIYSTQQTIKESFVLLFTRLRHLTWDTAIIKRMLKLLYSSIQLYSFSMFRSLVNRLHGRISNAYLVRSWAKTVKSLCIPESLYQLEEAAVAESLEKEIHGLYTSLRRIHPGMKVLAISEHISLKKDPIHKILDVDFLHSNQFLVDKAKMIVDAEIIINDGEDKLRIAKSCIRSARAKTIGLIIEDWDDVSLLTLPGIRFILYKPRLKRFIPKEIESRTFS